MKPKRPWQTKTTQPTRQKTQRKSGWMTPTTAATSPEINTWFVIAAGTLLLSTFSGSIGGGIVMQLRNLVANSWMIHADGPGLMALAKSLEYVLIAVLGVPL